VCLISLQSAGPRLVAYSQPGTHFHSKPVNYVTRKHPIRAENAMESEEIVMSVLQGMNEQTSATIAPGQESYEMAHGRTHTWTET
jgi:hypothetical protein